MRINDALLHELRALHEEMQERLLSDDPLSRIWLESQVITLEEVVKGIEGKSAHLPETGIWLQELSENPLKRMPDVTLIEAARQSWDKVKDNKISKRWFTSTDMNRSLREILPEQTVAELPRFISGHQWAPYMRKLVNMGVLEVVDLVGSQGGKSGKGYKLEPRYQRNPPIQAEEGG